MNKTQKGFFLNRGVTGIHFLSVLESLLLAVAISPLDAATQPPSFVDYPCQSAIHGQSFAGAVPSISEEAKPVTWRLGNAPAGMALNPTNGTPVWSNALRGRYYITLSASNQLGGDSIEWVLNVVSNNYAGMRIVSTRSVDLAVPAWYASWLEQWQPHHVIDAAYERLRRLTGLETDAGKQVVMFAPGMGGAVSGQPVQIGPGWMVLDPVDGWHFTGDVLIHEVGHNFNATMGMPDYNYWPWFDGWFHHGCELLERSILERLCAQPEAFGMTGAGSSNFIAHVQREKLDAENRFAAYRTYLASGGRATNYSGDTYGAWSRLCTDLQQRYGPSVLENTVRAYRRDGLPVSVRSAASTVAQRTTLLVCIMSAAAGADLRNYFATNGFDIDASFYGQVSNSVFSTLAALPDEDVGGGWKRSPINQHYYRLTGWAMPWAEGQRAARRAGGNLATIRSVAEEEWLLSRFGQIASVWIGYSDAGHEGVWTWVSGETSSYQDWGQSPGWPSEPNGGTTENYAVMNASGTSKWQDVSGNTRCRGIIEVTNLPVASPVPDVTVASLDAWLSKASSKTGRFIIVSTTNGPMQISLSAGGTAREGVDYVAIPHVVTIPANTNQAVISIQPLLGAEPGGAKSIVLTITNSPLLISPCKQAQMALLDNVYPVGGLGREVWTNLSGGQVSDLTSSVRYPNQPDVRDQVLSLEGGYQPGSSDENYGERLSGYVIPPVTGSYVFYVASDDSSELWLSTNALPIGKRKIAYVSGWTDFRSYTNRTSQASVPISLEQNKWYYLELLHKEGGGGDHLSVTWKPPGQMPPQNGAEPIPGSVLAAKLPSGWPDATLALYRQEGSAQLGLRLQTLALALQVMEFSEDLVHWVPLATNQPGQDVSLRMLDPLSTSRSVRFYRSRLLPP
jgi:hypothetical protein